MISRAWQTLARFESKELIRRAYKERHNRDISAQHAAEIAAPIIHARSYFKAAETAEFTVKPLLLYYGISNLSRGAVLMLMKGRREATLKSSHGLRELDWRCQMSKSAPDFGAIRIGTTAGGGFQELDLATENLSLLRHNSSAVNFPFLNKPMPDHSDFTLDDLLSRTPALSFNYKIWKNQNQCVEITNIEKIETGKIRLSIHDFEEARSSAMLIVSGSDFEGHFSDTSPKKGITGPDEEAKLPGLTDWMNQSLMGADLGSLHLISFYPGQIHISKIMSYYSISFALGMIVRYYPNQWTGLLRGLFADDALPVLIDAVALLEREYPQLIVDHLNFRRK